METIEYQRLARVERFHWWYQSIHNLVLSYVKPNRNSMILDAGCGTGGLTEKLYRYTKTVGIDISMFALSLKKNKNAKYINGSVNKLPFIENIFDIVISVSVLYHQLVNEKKAVSEMKRILKENGIMVIVLPAFSWLFSTHDQAVHTRRRYTLRQAEELIQEEGFKIIDKHYLFSFLFPVFIIKRIIEKLGLTNSRVSDLKELSRGLNSILIYLCKIEWIITKYIKLPFGSSLMIVAQKINE